MGSGQPGERGDLPLELRGLSRGSVPATDESTPERSLSESSNDLPSASEVEPGSYAALAGSATSPTRPSETHDIVRATTTSSAAERPGGAALNPEFQRLMDKWAPLLQGIEPSRLHITALLLENQESWINENSGHTPGDGLKPRRAVRGRSWADRAPEAHDRAPRSDDTRWAYSGFRCGWRARCEDSRGNRGRR